MRDLAHRLRQIFRERFDRRRIDDVEALTRFVRTRAAYVAQTSLYGYLKARMGTSFQRYFEDDRFSAAIREAAERLFESCLADLTVFAVATAARAGGLGDGEAAALARHCYAWALAEGLGRAEAGPGSGFERRLGQLDWAAQPSGETAFAGSVGDAIRLAPVIEEFKALDRESVSNAIRFRWRDVREQFRRRVDGRAVAAEWRRRRTDC